MLQSWGRSSVRHAESSSATVSAWETSPRWKRQPKSKSDVSRGPDAWSEPRRTKKGARRRVRAVRREPSAVRATPPAAGLVAWISGKRDMRIRGGSFGRRFSLSRKGHGQRTRGCTGTLQSHRTMSTVWLKEKQFDYLTHGYDASSGKQPAAGPQRPHSERRNGLEYAQKTRDALSIATAACVGSTGEIVPKSALRSENCRRSTRPSL